MAKVKLYCGGLPVYSVPLRRGGAIKEGVCHMRSLKKKESK